MSIPIATLPLRLAAMELVLAACLIFAAGVCCAAEETRITDSAGRQVAVPADIKRVYAAGPPASLFVYALAAPKLIGWTRALRPEEAVFLPPQYAELPELGRLTGRGNTANVEVVVAAKPDLDRRCRFVGGDFRLAGRPGARADRYSVSVVRRQLCANRADPAHARRRAWRNGARQRVSRLRRQYARRDRQARRHGARGKTAARLLRAHPERPADRAVRIDHRKCSMRSAQSRPARSAGAGGLAGVSLEQVLAWDPEVIVTTDPNFYAVVRNHPAWAGVRAVKAKRVYLSPHLPFGWFDFPPGPNRLIGLQWLAKILYPDLFKEDLRPKILEFYRLFYHREPNAAQLATLLADGTMP